MRNTFFILLFACTTFFFSTGIFAQLKQLTADQMLHENTNGLLKELPEIGGWKDDTNYILYRPVNKGFDTVLG